MWRYARQGVQDWVESSESGRQERVERILGARIVNGQEYLETIARDLTQAYGWIPVPALSVKSIKWAFFRLRQVGVDAKLMFDLVFLLQSGDKHIGFRLEPAHHRGERHKYSHVQLSSRFDQKRIIPEEPLEWLPTSYPAFPIPGTRSLDRFLMLVVALHGFPDRVGTVLPEIWPGRLGKGQEYVGRVHSLLNPT